MSLLEVAAAEQDALGRHLSHIPEMIDMASESLDLGDYDAEFVAALFHPAYYALHTAPSQFEDWRAAFRHYLEEGHKRDLPPGPFFDAEFTRKALREMDVDEPETPALILWLDEGMPAGVSLTPRFDLDYYLMRNEDIANGDLDPFFHFVRFGDAEGRPPSAFANEYIGGAQLNLGKSDSPLGEFLAQFPPEAARKVATGYALQRVTLTAMFQKKFYAAQFEEPLEENAKEERDLTHLLGVGLGQGMRPGVFFNSAYYLEGLRQRLEEIEAEKAEAEALAAKAAEDEETAADAAAALQKQAPDGLELRPVAPGEHPFLHWLIFGWRHWISPTPLFDEEFYINVNRDLQRWKRWLFAHLLEHGCRERGRLISEVFHNKFYADQRSEFVSPIFMVDFAVAGVGEGARPSREIAPWLIWGARGFTLEELRVETPLERLAVKLREKRAKLDTPKIRRLADLAAEIDPTIRRPYGYRTLQFPPLRHTHLGMADTAEKLRRALRRGSYDNVLLIPHCRQSSGAARVAGALSQSLERLYPDSHNLAIMTDGSEFERPDWFGANIETLDVSGAMQGLPDATQRFWTLLDLLRGAAPKRVFNVNSKLSWDFFQHYSNQVSDFTDLHAYLFCYDLDIHGNKGGYPIQWFPAAFDGYTSVICDNNALRNELIRRYAMVGPLRDKIRVAMTPKPVAQHEFSSVFEMRRNLSRPMRGLWAGRFDRQKRFDIVIEIAKARPDMQIWCWGRQVMNDAAIDLSALPSNVRMQGEFTRFDELPMESADFFLYTSEWDGLPTMLIEAGVRGLPIIAGSVGGVTDLIDEETGWPVHDYLNPEAFIEQMDNMMADPEQVGARARALREKTRSLCSFETYDASIRAAIDGEKPPVERTDEGEAA